MGAEEWSPEQAVYEEAVMKPAIFYANFFKEVRKLAEMVLCNHSFHFQCIL